MKTSWGISVRRPEPSRRSGLSIYMDDRKEYANEEPEDVVGKIAIKRLVDLKAHKYSYYPDQHAAQIGILHPPETSQTQQEGPPNKPHKSYEPENPQLTQDHRVDGMRLVDITPVGIARRRIIGKYIGKGPPADAQERMVEEHTERGYDQENPRRTRSPAHRSELTEQRKNRDKAFENILGEGDELLKPQNQENRRKNQNEEIAQLAA